MNFALQMMDSASDNGFRPAGLARLSRTTIDNVVYLQDHAKVFDSGTATHALSKHIVTTGNPHHDSRCTHGLFVFEVIR